MLLALLDYIHTDIDRAACSEFLHRADEFQLTFNPDTEEGSIVAKQTAMDATLQFPITGDAHTALVMMIDGLLESSCAVHDDDSAADLVDTMIAMCDHDVKHWVYLNPTVEINYVNIFTMRFRDADNTVDQHVTFESDSETIDEDVIDGIIELSIQTNL
jgi:tRNA isopentenyl-2-thiomethyl-A-37 hydroxylase MiaE